MTGPSARAGLIARLLGLGLTPKLLIANGSIVALWGAATWLLARDATAMRERVAQVGGELAVASRPGAGVSVVARVPLPSARPSESGRATADRLAD